jgi:hypothetical protein
MKSTKHQQRDAELRRRVSDVWLPKDVLDTLRELTHGTSRNYAEVDASILNIPQERAVQLHQLLKSAKDGKEGATLSLSYLDMIDLEQICLYAQRFGEDLVDVKEPGLSQDEIIALSKKLAHYRQTAFPED